MSVGALDENGNVWRDTNAITECNFLAPGVSILAINNEKQLFLSSGTSQATAITSGYISLLMDYANIKQIKLQLQKILNILTEIKDGKISYLDGFNHIR